MRGSASCMVPRTRTQAWLRSGSLSHSVLHFSYRDTAVGAPTLAVPVCSASESPTTDRSQSLGGVWCVGSNRRPIVVAQNVGCYRATTSVTHAGYRRCLPLQTACALVLADDATHTFAIEACATEACAGAAQVSAAEAMPKDTASLSPPRRAAGCSLQCCVADVQGRPLRGR